MSAGYSRRLEYVAHYLELTFYGRRKEDCVIGFTLHTLVRGWSTRRSL